MTKKIKSICIDGLTQVQVNEYMTTKDKPNHDKWKDYGQDIYSFIINLQKCGFEIVLVLGEPGTGKSSGMKTLESGTNIWYNTDKKNPTWKGGRAEYGTKLNPNPANHLIPTNYSSIIKDIKSRGKDAYSENPIAFITGHIETFKQGMETRVKLRTLGNLASKMRLEGLLEIVLYSRVKIEDGAPKFLLETQNNGFNTARCYEGMLPQTIPNDYDLILKAIESY